MSNREKHEGSTLTIVEAVETLSRIADMDLDQEVNFKESESTSPLAPRAVEWLQSGDVESTVKTVRETFRVILNYLHNFYEREYRYVGSPELTEGIKAIMLLVGEAAKKLDKYTGLLHLSKSRSVTELKEYRRLQEFYLTRIAHKVDDGMLGKWLIALTKQMMTVPEPAQIIKPKSLAERVFVDLDGVKKDSEYELFLIRKEDGTRFFNPRLIRNIKLVCDFGDYFVEPRRLDDPLESIAVWRDQHAHSAGKQILQPTREIVEAFYRHSFSQFEELKNHLSKALMALMLCSNAQNLLHDLTLKSCGDYFNDFRAYLRNALNSRDYQRFIAYPPTKSETEAVNLLELAQTLCKALFLHVQGNTTLSSHIAGLITEAMGNVSSEHADASRNSHLVWNRLASEYAAVTKLMKRHPNGPLFKLLDLLENGSYNAFDPCSNDKVMSVLFSMYVENRRVANVHMPAPIYQEFINKVVIIEEFKAFLLSLDVAAGEKHLLINLQDRTSWREHERCVVLEELQYLPAFADRLAVVTLAKDTEFYHQLPPYQDENHVNVFLQHFKEHLMDEASGFCFPAALKAELFPNFIDEVMRGVHSVFFSKKNVLTKEHRLNFIELVYLFVELKLIETVRPTSMSLTCKDGVDIGATASAELLLFLKLIREVGLAEHEFEQVTRVIYGPAIMERERIVLPERFHRLQNMVKTVELAREEFGPVQFARVVHEVFGLFFSTPILSANIS